MAYISRKSSKTQNEVATNVYILEVSGGLTISRIVGVYQNAGGIFIFIPCYTTFNSLEIYISFTDKRRPDKIKK